MRRDIATLAGIPEETVTIDSLTVGSLIVAFSVRETQGASGQRVNESFAQSQAAGDTQWMSNTAGVYAEVAPNETIAVEEAEAAAPPSGDTKAVCGRMCLAFYGIGVIVAFALLLLVSVLVWAFCCRKQAGPAADADAKPRAVPPTAGDPYYSPDPYAPAGGDWEPVADEGYPYAADGDGVAAPAGDAEGYYGGAYGEEAGTDADPAPYGGGDGAPAATAASERPYAAEVEVVEPAAAPAMRWDGARFVPVAGGSPNAAAATPTPSGSDLDELDDGRADWERRWDRPYTMDTPMSSDRGY